MLGAKANPAEPAYYVPAYLARQGYSIRPVNPRLAGSVCSSADRGATLADCPKPDVIEVFRRPEFLPGHADEILGLAVAAGGGVVPARHPQRRGRREARAAGIRVVRTAA